MATSATHLSILKKLRADTGEENLATNATKTVQAMDTRYSFSSTRVALSALRKEYPEDKLFIKEMADRTPKWHKVDESQEATETQANKFINWDNLLKFRDEYYEEMTPIQRFLLSIYTMLPPVRLDYTPMRIVARKPAEYEEGMNYYVRCKAPYFIFHAYKTQKQYGDREVKVPAPLKREIDKYLVEGQQYLLEDAGKPWTEAKLSQSVQKIFMQFHNMKTGVSMIRHAYSTKFHAGQLPLKALKKTAALMLHSPMQSMSYRFIGLENSY